MVTINTTVYSLVAKVAREATSGLDSAMEKLSTGSRIN